jgi:hypothetical protein
MCSVGLERVREDKSGDTAGFRGVNGVDEQGSHAVMTHVTRITFVTLCHIIYCETVRVRGDTGDIMVLP